ncbi:MAG: hypothetical protein QF911_02895 [Candidatus Thalassarchaeaceae archaeon]|nr:hypothetical protein [Candidatus Thalassarchaeaceae archaeon]
MADELSREEVTERLETIFSAALEGDELEKLISSIPKRLEKFEGRWDGLIKWAEKKYGSQDPIASEDSDEPEDDEEPEDAEEPEGKPAKKGGGLFSKFGRSKKAEAEPEEEAEAEPEEEAEAEPEEEAEAEPEEEAEAAAISEIDTVLQAIEGGDSEAALSSLKELATGNGSDPEVWRAMAAYFSSIGHVGRSKACEEQAESLS